MNALQDVWGVLVVVLLALQVGSWVVKNLKKLDPGTQEAGKGKGQGQGQRKSEGAIDDEVWAEIVAEEAASAPKVGATAATARTDGRVQRASDESAALRAESDRLVAEATACLREARVDRATARPAQVIEDYVLPQARALAAELSRGPAPTRELRGRLEHIDFVQGVVEAFIEQRRRPGLREALGDADEIARACYQPLVDFARVNRLALTSAEPLALLTRFDLSIWTGFIPTGVAPLFLPPAFFEDVRWWPAVAHEIGHDFLAATAHAEARLRAELGLPSEEVGRRPLVLGPGGLAASELMRLYGAWFEEIFCDVIGALMLGPAYGYTMVSLFATPHAPRRAVMVGAGHHGYDRHPPRSLRVHLCAHVLDLVGEDGAAEEIRAEWDQVHGDEDTVWVPTTSGEIGLPLALMNELAAGLATSLVREGKEGLDGHSLVDIPGLDYGPHLAAEARRACEEILVGRAPSQHRARAVVAGAVLAWRREPARHSGYVALARRAICGVREQREDIHAGAYDLPQGGVGAHPRANLRAAFVLSTILAPPPAATRRRRARPSFLARRARP
ncbi:hypothetical protein [Haliangium sp.]|uniref:hypothetical protein n=1 Tax=Haliangium sp. TaxID=2663208 RepID=UPI003D0A7F79